jgi:hypothetical protein
VVSATLAVVIGAVVLGDVEVAEHGLDLGDDEGRGHRLHARDAVSFVPSAG